MASGGDVDVVSKLEKAISYACGILGYEKLRDFQKEGVAAVLKDQDVFVAKPTGSGKSLIFQLVPFATDFIHKFDSEGPGLNLATLKENPENFALVVSPLISLMKDQVHQLKEKGITALSLSDENVTGEQLKKTNYSFLYSSPEAILRNYRKEFKSKELQKKLCCVVVDESHCIIKWGTTSKKFAAFRRCYSEIAQLRSLLHKRIPFVALTATATTNTANFIINNLELTYPARIVSVPERPNVRYSLVKVNTDKLEETFMWLLQKLEEDGEKCKRYLIFCRKHSHVRSLYALFEEKFGHLYNNNNRPYEMFHGSTEESVKTFITSSFADPNGTVRILFATIAFGMGVDCKNLHNVIHYGPPNGIDDLCQETGRAGRDNLQSHATLVVFPKCIVSTHVSKEMKDYLSNTSSCRRQLMLKHFPGAYKSVSPKHNCCDICANICTCDDDQKHCSFQANKEKFMSDTEINLPEVNNSSSPEAVDENLCQKQLCDITEEGKLFLKFRLQQLRYNLCKGKRSLYTGLDMTSGFPAATISKIIENVKFISTTEDIKRGYFLLDSALAEPILSIIKAVREGHTLTDDTDQLDRTMDSLCELNIDDLEPSEETDKICEATDSASDELSDNSSGDELFDLKRSLKYRVRCNVLFSSDSDLDSISSDSEKYDSDKDLN